MDASRRTEGEGLSATSIYRLAGRPGELDLTDDPAPPTGLQEVEAGLGVVTIYQLNIFCEFCQQAESHNTKSHHHTGTSLTHRMYLMFWFEMVSRRTLPSPLHVYV